jgi:hypothetical protein
MRGMKAAAVTIGLSAALTGGAVGLAGPASAANCVGGYPPASCTLTVSDSRVVVGQTLSYRGTGYTAGEKANVTVDSTLIGTIIANASGVATGSFTVPNLALGRHTLTVTGLSSGVVQSAKFVVVPKPAAAAIPAPSSSGPLAFTGSESAKAAGVGALLLLGGGALMMAGKRRKRVNAAI